MTVALLQDSDQLLDGLNDRQSEAVRMEDESAIVLAGAGSGKTKVLTTRIAWLISQERATPDSVLAVTFTNKAAREMRMRLAKMTGINPGRMWIGTFHGLCNRILREHHKDANLPAGFVVMDETDQVSLVKRLAKEVSLNSEKFPAADLLAFINRQKETATRAQKVEALTDRDKVFVDFYREYEKRCQKEGVVDFSELMLRTIELFQFSPMALDTYRQRFSHILVDEFQDTNAVQYTWLKALRGDKTPIFSVGDDDQSIYGFRLADPANMQHFVKEIAKGKVIRLEQNYRSTGSILKAANNLIENNSGRLGKNLWTDSGDGQPMHCVQFENDLDEADFIAGEGKRLIGAGLAATEIAVLYRANAQSRNYERAMITAGVPYVIYGGTRFFERMEIKNVLAYLRLAINVEDDGAFLRIINFPPRGIGEQTVEVIQGIAKENDVPLLECAASHYAGKASDRIGTFILLLTDIFEAATTKPLPEFIDHVIVKTGLASQYAKKEEDQDRLENLQELVTAAIRFCEESIVEGARTMPAIEILPEFLSGASLESSNDRVKDKEKKEAGVYNPNAVTLMTVHAAKGLEFDTVFLGGVEENLFPHRMAIAEGKEEEERRLMYVAITRAKRQLFATHAKSRMLYGQTESNAMSRFLEEIPAELMQRRTIQAKRHTPTYYGGTKRPQRPGSGVPPWVAKKRAGAGGPGR